VISVDVEKNMLAVRETEVLTSGSVNVSQVSFCFDQAWEDMVRTAVFRAGEVSRSVVLDQSGVCPIPWEVLTAELAGRTLYVGVFGLQGEQVVLPTVWGSLGTIQAGTGQEESAQEPTPDVYQQLLAAIQAGMVQGPPGPQGEKGDKGDKGDPGTGEHSELTGRDAEDQHPMTAITGLSRALGDKLDTQDAMSNMEIYQILEE
jgi:hypothetical protein